jgi:hypothetical protein
MVRRHYQMLVSIGEAVRLKKGRETVKNEPHERRLRTSITGENSDRVSGEQVDNCPQVVLNTEHH